MAPVRFRLKSHKRENKSMNFVEKAIFEKARKTAKNEENQRKRLVLIGMIREPAGREQTMITAIDVKNNCQVFILISGDIIMLDGKVFWFYSQSR